MKWGWTLRCVIGAVLSAAACGGPGGGGRAPKVALIGWDGATWRVIEPMLAQGRLPNLQRLIAGGRRGVLRAAPPLVSPAAWTTLATGFPPAEHGITGFLLPAPSGGGRMLAASFHRRRPALWQMVSAEGREVGFVGWWSTWPAEPVRGYLVSDHLAYNRWAAWAPRGEHAAEWLAYPPELEAELRPLAVDPLSVRREDLEGVIPFDEEAWAAFEAARRPVMFDAPSVVKFGYATDASNRAFAAHLLQSRPQPALFSVTFVLSDVAGHVFWHYFEPGAYGDAAPEPGPLREAVPNVYDLLDRWTGEILDALDPETTVFVISDHGMRAAGRAPEPGRHPAGDHEPDGILVVSGPRVRRGDAGVVEAVDLAPTVLAALDLPVARDMPGRAHVDWFHDTGVRWVDTYRDRVEAFQGEVRTSPAEEAYRERLRSLGYLD